MGDIPANARAVIIGGGVIGVSCLYHLAKAGWTDCVLVDMNELTSGSTWHAAGNVPTFSSSWGVMQMQRYSADLYQRLGDEVDYPINYHVTGSLRLAHTDARVMEFERVMAMARHQGMEMEMLDLAEAKNRYPFLATHDLKGVLYDPIDGDIDPAQLTQALAKGARDLGARIERFCPVTGVRRDDSAWIIETGKGDIRADYVVNAAGYRAQEVGAMFDRDVPMMVMSHQYILFDEIPELAARTAETGQKLPLLRDVDSSYYLRQEKNGMNLGPYERKGRAHWASDDDRMPDDFSFQLFPDDLDRLEWYLEDALERVPLLGTAGLSKVINGPIPYAPDGNPLIGPMPGVPNAFEACVFTFGIAQAGGAGKVLSEWVIKGRPEWDMWACDPRRFTDFTDAEYCIDKGLEVYQHEYAIHFPRHVWPAARGRKISPIHEQLSALGAQFAPYNGWERAYWFAETDDDTSEAATETWDRNGPWEPRVRAECEAVRDAAGILDLSGFSRFDVAGDGSRAWLSKMITGRVPAPGRVGLGYFCDEDGRVITEMSILALSDDAFQLITAATAQWHDRDWLTKHLPDSGSITISDVTKDWSCQVLTGPKSRDILAPLTDADLAAPWLTHQQSEIAGRPCRLARVSYAGELGWEVHCQIADTPVIFDAVWAAGQPFGLKPFGMLALDSLRLEKSYKAWKGDLSTDYTPLQLGLERFIDFAKDDFIGKAALEAERDTGAPKKFVTLVFDDLPHDPPYMSSLFSDGKIVGELTSAGYGYRTGRLIGLGMVRADLARPGAELTANVFGSLVKARVQPDGPLWDPDNSRLRA